MYQFVSLYYIIILLSLYCELAHSLLGMIILFYKRQTLLTQNCTTAYKNDQFYKHY